MRMRPSHPSRAAYTLSLMIELARRGELTDSTGTVGGESDRIACDGRLPPVSFVRHASGSESSPPPSAFDRFARVTLVLASPAVDVFFAGLCTLLFSSAVRS